MPSENQKHLARPINSVKKLSGEVKISSSYYSDIKPFLFGTDSTDTLTPDNLPNTGIHNKVTSSGLIAGNSRDVIVDLEGRGKTELKRADIADQRFVVELSDGSSGVLASDYLFPSDLVSILVSLSKKFYEKDYKKSNNAALQRFAHSGDNLALVKKWGKPQAIKSDQGDKKDKEDYFLERNLFTSDAEVKELLDVVVTAALEYEASKKKIDHSDFIHESDLKKELTKDVVSDILENFKEYRDRIFEKTEEKLVKAAGKIKEAIEQIINDDSYFFDKLLTTENLESFEEQEAYYEEQKTFKLAGENDFPGVLETEEYSLFKKEAVESFLEKNKQSLIKEFIDPLTEKETDDEVVETSQVEDEDQSGDIAEEQVDQENFSISRSDFQNKASDDLSDAVFNTFIEQINDRRFSLFQNNFLDNPLVANQVSSLREKINSDVSYYVFSNDFLSSRAIESLQNEDLLNDSDAFLNTVFESDWYLDFINKTSLSKFLVSKGSEYFQGIFKSKVDPALDILEKEDSDTTTVSDSEDKKAKSSTAVVPGATTTQQPPSSQRVGRSEAASAAPTTYEQQQAIAKEISKLKVQAFGDLIGTYELEGLENSKPLTEQINKQISTLFGELSDSERSKLVSVSSLGRLSSVGSSSSRKMFLAKVYAELGKSAEGKEALVKFYEEVNVVVGLSSNSLDKVKLEKFKEFYSNFVSDDVDKIILPNTDVKKLSEKEKQKSLNPKSRLEKSLNEILDSNKDITANKNIENAIGALILQGKSQAEIKKELEEMSQAELAAFMGVSSINSLTEKDLNKLKSSLLIYSAEKNLGLTINSPKISNIDKSQLSRHLDFASARTAIKNMDDNNGNGAEIIAGAMGHKKGDRERKIKQIAKQYKSFFGLWENLSAAEQKIVYKKYNIAYDKNTDRDRKLAFVPEFLLFDVSSLNSFKGDKLREDQFDQTINLGDTKYSTEDFQQYLYGEATKSGRDYLEQLSEQVFQEEQYAQFLRDSYIFNTEEHQALLIADYLASQYQELEMPLTRHPDEAFFDQFSANEIMAADQHVQDSGYSLSPKRRHLSRSRGLIQRFKNSKLGKRLGLGKVSDSSKKMSKALKSKASKKLTSAINALPPGLATTALKIIRKIGFKRSMLIVSAVVGALIGGLFYLINPVLRWIKSLFGLRSIGPGAGAFGLASDPESVTAINTTSNSATANSIRNSSTNAATTTELTGLRTTTATGGITSASGVFFGLPIAILAPGITMFIGLIVTIYTVFTIQSAFLIPTPSELKDIKDPGSFKCDGSSIPKPDNTGVIMSGDGQYAYPMINSTGTDNCSHWDGALAIDIYTGQAQATDPQKNLTLVAYTGGRINQVVSNDGLGGIYVILKGDNGNFYYYAHLCTSYVTFDQRVEAGEVIGITNQSGLNAEVTPEHLHFAIQEGGTGPSFFDGGNICPFTEFREKFGMELCAAPGQDCVLP